jgi:hypothetical protein
VIIDRLLGKLVYLARLSDCIIASLYGSHLLVIEISLYYLYLQSSSIHLTLCLRLADYFKGKLLG